MSRVNSVRLKLAKAALPMLVIIGWGLILSSLALTAIVEGLVIPHNPQFEVQSALLEIVSYYLGIFMASFIAGLVLRRIDFALLGFIVSYTIGIIVCYTMLILPGLLGYLSEGAAENQALVFVFTAFFPIALFAGLLGAIIGGATREV